MKDSNAEQELRIRTRRGFLTLGVGGALGLGAWLWMKDRLEGEGLAQPFRGMLEFNRRVAETYYDEGHLAPVFPASSVQQPKVNGGAGLSGAFDPGQWRLTIRPSNRVLTIADIQALPRVEHITTLKCIEGWSTVVHWAGARFSDFTAKYAPESAQAPYVGMQTPDEQYFVGLDAASTRHPQTLLCYEMNGAPLTIEHGAPLRLVIPVKYGIKNIKRIGTIEYTAERPRDYWAEDGYDWYAGL